MDISTKEGLEEILKIVDETNLSTHLTDYHKMRRREGVLAVHEMLQQPCTSEDMRNQILRSRKKD